MKKSNLIIAILVVLILSVLAYLKLTAKIYSSLAVEDMPVDSKEFVWVRMDSLSRGLMDISGSEITVDSTKSKSYIITYTSKKYLLHEVIEGIKTNRKHLLENAKDLMEYKEDDNKVEISLNKVEISLNKKDKFVYCPVLILDRILYWKNKQSTK